MTNRLYYGDNLDILRSREYFPDACVDLIYLDPPFNSNRNYNVLFRSESGADSQAQITAFEDTWHWGETAEETYRDLITDAPEKVSTAIEALLNLIDRNQMMAYLVMMTARLVELHRVLKATGSLYLHCDPTASHYLKIVLDAIFDNRNFRNEIIWHYRRWTAGSKHFQRMHDVILRYTKSQDFVFNLQYEPYGDWIKKDYGYVDEETGKRWRWHTVKGNRYKVFLEDENRGVKLNDVWIIPYLGSTAKERLGYPTQKPLALLERIIRASSNEGDIVLDPFCGCGTAIAAAHKLNRQWIGIDITHLSIALQKYRLGDMFELESGKDYEVIGEPTTEAGARELAQDSANEGCYQFEWWALSLVGAKPVGGQAGSKRGKKGADKGIDGIINFFEQGANGKARARKVVVQVKSGAVKAGDIRDLAGTIEREQAAIGVFVTLESPTQPMRKEALAAGYYESDFWQRSYRRLQILSIRDLFAGERVDMPPQHGTFKQAARARTSDGKQQSDLI
ncbi:MAG: DNA methyltransferase [Chloroflexi bacterium]|nr:DNA methyltransferase [Chloroflexota bacterium]